MENLDDNEIGKLLRLKRYEQPPPGYFEDFLHEFHRRQRDELLRQPLWSVLWQRISDSLFRLNLPSLTSMPAAAMAVLICAAVITFKISQAPSGPNVAATNASTPVALQPSVLDQLSASQRMTADNFSLGTPIRVRSLGPDLSQQVNESAYTHRAAPPRYVLDRLPVSYEPSFNF